VVGGIGRKPITSGERTVFLLCAYQTFMKALKRGYRPERHYMRGPGPKWRERHPDEASKG